MLPLKERLLGPISFLGLICPEFTMPDYDQVNTFPVCSKVPTTTVLIERENCWKFFQSATGSRRVRGSGPPSIVSFRGLFIDLKARATLEVQGPRSSVQGRKFGSPSRTSVHKCPYASN